VKILIEGKKVQGIGYRMFLLERALLKGIGRLYARNIDENKVELLVSDEEPKVNDFYEVISSEKPKDADVANIKKEPYEDAISIPSIDRYFQFLILEQVGREREEVVGLPEILVKTMEPVASALIGINEKFAEVVDKFGVFGGYARGIDEKLDVLPERIAEAMDMAKKKPQP
jgi:acylphosphatase